MITKYEITLRNCHSTSEINEYIAVVFDNQMRWDVSQMSVVCNCLAIMDKYPPETHAVIDHD